MKVPIAYIVNVLKSASPKVSGHFPNTSLMSDNIYLTKDRAILVLLASCISLPDCKISNCGLHDKSHCITQISDTGHT